MPSLSNHTPKQPERQSAIPIKKYASFITHMSLKKEIGRANMIFSIGKVASAAVAFFLNIYLAKLLQPYEFGLYSFAMVIIGAAALFTDFGINNILFKFGSEERYQKDRPLLKSLISLTFKYKLILLLLVCGALALFPGKIALFFGKSQVTEVIVLSSIILFATTISEYLFSMFLMMKSFKNQSVFRIVEQLLKAAMILVFLLLGFKAYGALIGNAASYILLALIMGYSTLKSYPKIFESGTKALDYSKLRAFGVWSTTGVIIGTIYGMTDKLLISKMLPVENVGFYQLAYSWVFAIIYLVPMSYQVMFVYYSNSNASKEKLTKMLSDSIKYTGLLSFPFSFLLSAFSGAFIIFLYGTSYLPAAGALKVLSLTVSPMLFAAFFLNYFISINKPEIQTKVFIPLTIILFILDLVLIPTYGIVGAAYGMLFIKILEMLIFSYLLFFKEKIRLPLDIVWKPMLASFIVYVLLDFALPQVFREITLVHFIISGGIAILMYFSLMLLLKGITKEEIRQIISVIR
ncbi:Polysaccharide biosynthesis protein [uncultured archaeon]|nr:Polysaccharide biosynthesis protein [uncultured archaeon]